MMTLLLYYRFITSDLTVSIFLGFQSDRRSDCIIIVSDKLLLAAKPILVCLMAKCTYKTQTYRPTDNA